MTDTVHFISGGVRCAAWHFRGTGEGPRPCVVLAHGFSATADSGLLAYAEVFAAAGYDAVVFDYRGFGFSEGEPRQDVDPGRQIADWHAAIAFARALPGVDPDRIALFGTSFSGGHVIRVAAEDGRVAAVIAQTPATDGLAAVLSILRDKGVAHVLRLTLVGVRDLAARLRGTEPVYVPAVGPPGSVAVMTTPDAVDGFASIAGPSWENRVRGLIMLRIGLHRPGRRAKDLPCPALFIVADEDAIVPPQASLAAASAAPGRAEVRHMTGGHFEPYTGERFDRATGWMVDFLARHLAPASAPASAS